MYGMYDYDEIILSTAPKKIISSLPVIFTIVYLIFLQFRHMKEVKQYSCKRHVIKNIRIYVQQNLLELKISCLQIDSNTIDGK